MEKGGQTLSILNITYNSKKVQVYNLTVANGHTYYVTKDEVLVHNAGVCKFPTINWNKILKGDVKNGKARGYHHNEGGIIPSGRSFSNVRNGPAGFYSADVSIPNSVGTIKPKFHRSTFFPDRWPESKVNNVVNAAIVQVKGKSGTFDLPLKSISSENIRGVFIRIKINGEKLEQAFPLIPEL